MLKKLILVLGLFIISCGGNPSMPGNSQTGLKIIGTADAQTRLTMENSLNQLFSEVKLRGYTKELSLSDYTITIKDDCVDRNGTKAWLERLDSYDGSVYDQDPTPGIGMIYQSERVTPPNGPFIICRDTLAIMSKTTRYGGEHWVLYANDRPEFERTKGPSHAHPIIQ